MGEKEDKFIDVMAIHISDEIYRIRLKRAEDFLISKGITKGSDKYNEYIEFLRETGTIK